MYVKNFVGGFWSIWSQEKVPLRFTDLIEQPKSANLHWPVEVTWVATMCFKFLSCQMSHVTQVTLNWWLLTQNDHEWKKTMSEKLRLSHSFGIQMMMSFNKFFDHSVPSLSGIWKGYLGLKYDCEGLF